MSSHKNTSYQIPQNFNSSEIMEPINNFPYASKIINENTIIKESVWSLITFNKLNSKEEITINLSKIKKELNFSKNSLFTNNEDIEKYNKTQKEALNKIISFLNTQKNIDEFNISKLSFYIAEFIFNNMELNIWPNDLPLLYTYFIKNWTLEWFNKEREEDRKALIRIDYFLDKKNNQTLNIKNKDKLNDEIVAKKFLDFIKEIEEQNITDWLLETLYKYYVDNSKFDKNKILEILKSKTERRKIWNKKS